jgi:uncharacterized protein
MAQHEFTNALAGETSPYLLQHARNPVQWYPWGKEAFRRAREEDKPILLSIGYSACHWCHVMERESFENREIAHLMNQNFINIKVDREERPDLDSIYMTFVQMTTGRGGWPMTVFLTPDQRPFYGGTYFPPEDRFGVPAFPRVLESVARAYRENKQSICQDAERITRELEKADSFPSSDSALTAQILDDAAAGLTTNYDSENGGFGGAPKFPSSMTLSFLLRSYLRTGQARFLEIAQHTLAAMALGGIYDQLGSGFHRYSVDARWQVPHFEKMLYDNALLSQVYLEAYLLTQKRFYGRIVQETLDYVVREMTSPDGGFYSSQDADSENQEGRFFVWTPKEIEEVLGMSDAERVCRYYGVKPEGQVEGKSVLSVSQGMGAEIPWGERKLLFEARNQRVKPARDEKILTSWNALMLKSFAEAANGLDREDYRQTALRNGEFILNNLLREGELMRSFRNGTAKYKAYLEDYACLIDALLSLYEATFDARWISTAESLASMMVEKFWDKSAACFYFTSSDHEALIHRPRELYDNVIPSGNSAATFALLRLHRLSANSDWSSYAIDTFKKMAHLMSRHPSAFCHMLSALDYYLSPLKEIAVAGEPHDKKTWELLKQIFHRYLPNKVVVCGTDDRLALLKERPQLSGQPTVYVCVNSVCLPPVTEPENLAPLLEFRTQTAGPIEAGGKLPPL